MTQYFEVRLSTDSIAPIWGDDNKLAYDASGAVIHLESLEDNSSNLSSIQKSARTIAGFKSTHIQLIGDWSLEAQWHFWQGLFSPDFSPSIEFANLTESEKKSLDARIQIFTWARNIINRSPEALSPELLAREAGEFIKQLAPNNVSYKVVVGDDLKDQHYVGIHGVGRGSDRPPAYLDLEFIPDGEENSKVAIALVGKGITFDSGGYSMKSTLGMLHMKADMGGAATVTGALALAICEGLTKRTKLFLCCAENLVSGHAYKLSDILTYRNGVSVEVVNTDAEGRLVLADGLIDADNSGAELIIDAATLTGAAVVAVGEDYNALFSMDNELAKNFDQIASESFDPVWRLPLAKMHQSKCPSSYADTANSKPVPGGGAGGASNAAGFLSRFLETPEKGWLHVDLAACYQDSGNGLWSAGATGAGIRSIATFISQKD